MRPINFYKYPKWREPIFTLLPTITDGLQIVLAVWDTVHRMADEDSFFTEYPVDTQLYTVQCSDLQCGDELHIDHFAFALFAYWVYLKAHAKDKSLVEVVCKHVLQISHGGNVSMSDFESDIALAFDLFPEMWDDTEPDELINTELEPDRTKFKPKQITDRPQFEAYIFKNTRKYQE